MILPLSMLILSVLSLTGSCVYNSILVYATVSSYMPLPGCVHNLLFPCNHPPTQALRIFPPLLLQSALRFERRECDIKVPFSTEYSLVSYPLHVGQLGSSLCVNRHVLHKRHLSDEVWDMHWSLSIAISHSESVTTVSFNRIRVVCSFWGPMTCLAIGLRPG